MPYLLHDLEPEHAMTSFVLVHGGAHAGWCWERVVPWLEADARVEHVLAVDLPGHGAKLGQRPLEAITREDYVADVIDAIESRDLRDVVLVGHSLAGITIPEVANRIPGRIRRVVFLSTTNPAVGQSVLDRMQDPRSPVARGVDATRMFCNDLDADTTAWLLERLGPEPPGPLSAIVAVAGAPPEVPSTYVLLERDEALPPDFQREQAATAGVDEVVRFDAGHSAFASRPRALAELLLGWA